MTINIHSLLHVPQTVVDLGPLWAHSCFPFENQNGLIKKVIRGSQHIDTQVRGVYIIQSHQCACTKLINLIILGGCWWLSRLALKSVKH